MLKKLPSALTVACILASTSGCATSFQEDPQVAQRAELERHIAAALLAEDQGVICENVQPVGTRIERRQCTTAEQREEMHKTGKQFVERIQNGSLIGNVQ